jgi:hypothetical protein
MLSPFHSSGAMFHGILACDEDLEAQASGFLPEKAVLKLIDFFDGDGPAFARCHRTALSKMLHKPFHQIARAADIKTAVFQSEHVNVVEIGLHGASACTNVSQPYSPSAITSSRNSTP